MWFLPLLATAAAFLSDAESQIESLREVGGGMWGHGPRLRVVAARFHAKEPHWRTDLRTLDRHAGEIPVEPYVRWLVEVMSSENLQPVLRLSPYVWIGSSSVLRPFRNALLSLGYEDAEVRAVGEFLEVRFPLQGLVLKAEGWSEACLSEGYGPWSVCYSSSFDEFREATSPCEDEEDFLPVAIAESEVRIRGIASGNVDGPPAGADSWELDLWFAMAGPDRRNYPIVQVTVWRMLP